MPIQPNVPSGPVYLALDPGQPKLYSCGDEVRGTVVVDSHCRTDLLTVHFKCRVKSLISRGSGDSESIYSVKNDLFHYCTTFIKGSDVRQFVAQGEPTLTFRFKFPVPWTVHNDPPKPYGRAYVERPGRFEHAPGHPLPPTFACPNHQGRCVEYYVEAIMARPKSLFHSVHKVRLPIVFCPPIPSTTALLLTPAAPTTSHAVEMTRHSFLLDPVLAREQVSLHVRNFFHIKKTPEPFASFCITAHTPTVLRVTHPIPIRLGLVHTSRSDTLSDPPALVLRGCHLRLLALTHMRVPLENWKGDDGQYEVIDTLLPSKQPLYDRLDMTPGVVMYDDMSLNEVLRPLAVHARITPSFRSYSLARTYELQLILMVECAGKVLELKFKQHPVDVLSGIVRDSEEGPPAYLDVPEEAPAYYAVDQQQRSEVAVSHP